MQRLSPNYRYFRKHFGQLAERYGGRMVVIASGRFYGSCSRTSPLRLQRMVDRARKEFPRDLPLVTPVPTLKELAKPLLL